MPGDLRVSLRLTAEDLMSPQIVEALTKLQLLEQQTARLNGGQQAAANGTHAHAAAQAELAEKATLSARALEVGTEAGARFGEEMLAGAARIGASLIGFELIVQSVEKVMEAEREAEVANRQLTARFGESAGEYREFSEEVATGTNFTTIQFERAASALQPLIRDYGLTDEELQRLVETTADLAAANGVPLQSAASMVAATMRGQARAGAELGLNIRANVIAGMDELTDAEKRAAVEGDNVASAHARLRVIEIEAADAQGQAAEAAGATGDSFARLDKQTAALWETMGDSHAGKTFAGTMATAAESIKNLILLHDRAMQIHDEGGSVPVGTDLLSGAAVSHGLERGLQNISDLDAALEASLHNRYLLLTYGASGRAREAGIAGLVGSATPLSAEELRQADEAVKAAEHAQNLLDLVRQRAGERGAGAVDRPFDVLTRAQELAQQTGEDYRDETNRAIEAQRSYGTELERSAQKVADLDRAMQASERNRSQLGGYEKALTEDRALRRRLGLPELAGETDALRQAYKVDYQNRLAEGPEALAALLGHLRAGDFDAQTVQVDTQTVTAGTVIVNGQAQGGGNQSSISGGVGPWANARWSAARGVPYDPRTMGIGRAIG